MCSAITCDVILDVLTKAMNAGDVFTAYDVTVRARTATTDSIPHCDVRDIVRSEFVKDEMEGYSRKLSKINSAGSPDAFVYYPDGKKASDHSLVDDTTDNDGDDDTASTDDGDVFTLTAEGRVNIPKSMLDKVDAPAGSYSLTVKGVGVICNPNKDGRVRLGLRTLGVSGSKCRIEVNIPANTIDIESI